MQVPLLHTEHPGSAAAHGLGASAGLIKLLARNTLRGAALTMHKCCAANTQQYLALRDSYLQS